MNYSLKNINKRQGKLIIILHSSSINLTFFKSDCVLKMSLWIPVHVMGEVSVWAEKFGKIMSSLSTVHINYTKENVSK